MDIVVDEELKAYIAPLTADEHESLERSILAEGCRDALVVWGNLLIDGHNRFGICQKHGLPFQTVQNTRFNTMEDVHLWMIDQHLGRRSVSDYQRGVLALRKREIMAQRKHAARASAQVPDHLPDHLTDDVPAAADAAEAPPAGPVRVPESESLATRDALARAARLSPSQVVMIEKIQKQAAPQLVEAVASGAISISAAVAVSTLPAEEQIAAVAAGKDELRQAAKRVRDAKRKPPAEKTEAADSTEAPAEESVESLKQQVTALKAENAALRGQLERMEEALASAGVEAPSAPW